MIGIPPRYEIPGVVIVQIVFKHERLPIQACGCVRIKVCDGGACSLLLRICESYLLVLLKLYRNKNQRADNSNRTKEISDSAK